LWRAFGATTGRQAEQQGNDKVPHGPTFFFARVARTVPARPARGGPVWLETQSDFD
jgi:hypothetical protein